MNRPKLECADITWSPHNIRHHKKKRVEIRKNTENSNLDGARIERYNIQGKIKINAFTYI